MLTYPKKEQKFKELSEAAFQDHEAGLNLKEHRARVRCESSVAVYVFTRRSDVEP